MIDRRGFYTGAGLFNVDEWNKTQRALLAVAEVLLFFIALVIYVIRIGMVKFYPNTGVPIRPRRGPPVRLSGSPR